MSISLEGLQSFNGYTVPPEERALANIKVVVDGQSYDWQIFIPKDTTNIDEFLHSQLSTIQQDIRNKELQWQNLNPKTRTISDPIMGNRVIDINKSEIVRPDIPDYSTKRRIEYPSIYDQLDALWKGPSSQEYQFMKDHINQIKSKYPR
jgi:hypothetical protein